MKKILVTIALVCTTSLAAWAVGDQGSSLNHAQAQKEFESYSSQILPVLESYGITNATARDGEIRGGATPTSSATYLTLNLMQVNVEGLSAYIGTVEVAIYTDADGAQEITVDFIKVEHPGGASVGNN